MGRCGGRCRGRCGGWIIAENSVRIMALYTNKYYGGRCLDGRPSNSCWDTLLFNVLSLRQRIFPGLMQLHCLLAFMLGAARGLDDCAALHRHTSGYCVESGGSRGTLDRMGKVAPPSPCAFPDCPSEFAKESTGAAFILLLLPELPPFLEPGGPNQCSYGSPRGRKSRSPGRINYITRYHKNLETRRRLNLLLKALVYSFMV